MDASDENEPSPVDVTEGFTLLQGEDEEDKLAAEPRPQKTACVGVLPPEVIWSDYPRDSRKRATTVDPTARDKIERLERENEDLLKRLAVLEALVFRGDGERSTFLNRLSDRVGEVDRWIVQHERTRNSLIRRHVPCGFVPDHTVGNGVSPYAELGPMGLLSPLFHG